MADITTALLTVAVLKQRILRGSPGGVRVNTVRLTYATGEYRTSTGLPPPTARQCGMSKNLEYVTLIEAEADLGYSIKWDYDTGLFRIYAMGGAASHTHDLYLATGAATNANTVAATTGIISGQIAVTITGKTTVTAAATSGGVISNSAVVTTAATELTDSTTVAEIMLVVQAWGY